MEDKVLLGEGEKVSDLSYKTWQQELAQVPLHAQHRLGFMTEAHHRVRYFVVKEMAIRQKPIEPTLIAEKLGMPLERVLHILAELEEKLFFLVRDAGGAVAWAYPVTVQPTPHRLQFASGERLYGA